MVKRLISTSLWSSGALVKIYKIYNRCSQNLDWLSQFQGRFLWDFFGLESYGDIYEDG